MATLRTVIVDTDNSFPGVDYTALDDAELNEQGNIGVTSGSDEYVVFECHATSGTDDVNMATFDGWTTEVDNYIEIITPAGSSRHDGAWLTGNQYRMSSSGAGISSIYMREEYSKLTGLMIECTESFCMDIDSDFSEGWLKISECIFRKEPTNTNTSISSCDIRMDQRASSPGFTAYIWNNIIYDFDTSGSRGILVSDAMYAYIYNNTVYNCDTGIEQRDNFYAISMVCKNNITNSCAAMDYEWDGSTIDVTSTHNVGDNLNDGESDFGATWTTGTTTGAATGKLIDTGKNFNSIGVRVNSVVRDSGTGIAYVTAIDSDTQLSVSSNIFSASEAYKIYKNTYGNVTFTNEGSDIFTLGSSDTAAKDMGVDLSSDTDLPFSDDILEYTRPYNSIWDVGAHEYEPGGVTINFTGTISPVTLISGGTILRIMDLADTINGVFNVTGGTILRIMDLSGIIDTSEWRERYENTFGYDKVWDTAIVGGSSTYDPNQSSSSVTGSPANWDNECLKVDAVSGENCYNKTDVFGQEEDISYLKFDFIIDDASGLGNLDNRRIFRLVDSGDNTQVLGDIRKDSGGNLKCSLDVYHDGSPNFFICTPTLSEDTKYNIEFKWDVTNQKWGWRLDGANQPNNEDGEDPVTQDGSMSGVYPSGIRYMYIGSRSFDDPVNIIYYIDNIVFDINGWVGAFDLSSTADITRSFTGQIDSVSSLASLLKIGRDLSGTIDVLSSTSGNLKRIVDLLGTINTATDIQALIKVIYDLTGSIDTVTSLSSLIKIVRLMSGSIDSATSLSATIDRIVDLLGTVSASTDISGLLKIVRLMSGSSDSVTNIVALLDAVRNLSGTVDSVTLLQGLMHVISDFSGIIAAATDVTGGTILRTIDLTGTIDGLFNTASTIDVTRSISGQIDGVFYLTGTLEVGLIFAGTISALTFLQSTIDITRALTGTINAVISTQSSSTVIRDLSGIIDSETLLAGLLHVISDFSGIMAAGTNVDGLLNVVRNLTGAIDNTTLTSGSLKVIRDLDSIISTTSNIDSSLDVVRSLSGISAVVTFIEASLTIETILYLTGTINVNSAIAAATRIVRDFTGQIDSQTDAAGSIRSTRSISGTIDVGTTVAGLINVLRSLSGDVATSTTLVANINRLIDLTGAIDVFTDLSSSSNIIRDLSGYIDTVTSTSGFLRNNIGLSGAINVVTYLFGELRVFDPSAYREIIYLISEINKEITGESQITKLLNYNSRIETIIPELSTVTKVLNIMSNLE